CMKQYARIIGAASLKEQNRRMPSKPSFTSIAKRIVKRIFNATGYELRSAREVPPHDPGIRHAEVFPSATYSPWLSDEEFIRVFELVRKNTLVDRYRCFELWQLVAEVAKLPSGELMEIGVWRGGTGALLAKRCQLTGIEDLVYLCDTFRGVVKAGALDADYVGGEHADTTKDAVISLIEKLGLGHVRVLEGVFPEDSGDSLRDHRFRFCHIDVDVYDSARDIVDWLWPRL